MAKQSCAQTTVPDSYWATVSHTSRTAKNGIGKYFGLCHTAPVCRCCPFRCSYVTQQTPEALSGIDALGHLNLNLPWFPVCLGVRVLSEPLPSTMLTHSSAFDLWTPRFDERLLSFPQDLSLKSRKGIQLPKSCSQYFGISNSTARAKTPSSGGSCYEHTHFKRTPSS